MSKNYEFSSIRNILNANLEVSYKQLFIGKLIIQNRSFIQVHSDYFKIKFSKLYKEDELGWAISKFLDLQDEYKRVENTGGLFN